MPPYANNASKLTSKSLISSVWAEIKKPTMIVFPLLLFYKIVSIIQVLALMLEIPMNFFSNKDGQWRIMSITRAFIFFEKFDFQSNDPVTGTVFNISWILISFTYLVLIIVAISAKLQMSRFNWLSKVLNHLMIIHQFVFFCPIHVLMLGIIYNCSEYNIRMLDSTNDSLFFALAILILALNFGIGVLNLQCYSSLYVPKTFTKRNSYLSSLDLIFKTIMSIYITFFVSTVYTKWIAIVIIIIYVLISLYVFHSQYPFFQIKLLEAYCYLLGAKLALALSITLVAIFDEFRSVPVPDLPAAAFIFSLPLCIKGQRHQMIKTFMQAIVFDEKSYKIECDVFTHMLALRFLFKKGADMSIKFSKKDATNWNMQLNGVLIRHNDTCSEANCGCRTFLEAEETFKGIGTKREKYRELKIILMRDLYEKGIEKVPHSELILLNLAQFYLLYLENYLRSYLVLQAFEKRANKSLVTNVLVDYLKKRIQERMELKLSGNSVQSLIGDYETSGLNVTALVQNDIIFIQLKKLVQEQVLRQLKFWDLLDNFELSTKAIEVCCDEIDVNRNKIEKLWDNLSRINHKCSSHYLLYGLYQTLINNTTKRGERFLNDYCRMIGVGTQEKDGITNDNMYDPQTVVIRISMRRDKIGMIEESSGELGNLFGYQPSEIIDTNVATLMSAFFKERHHNFVMNHFEKGTENVLNRVKRLFGYHKDGHIFPMFLYVSIYPNIETNLSYMGIIRPRKVYNNYILLKSDGTVDSYSPEIAEYLGLESRKRYNISEICPEFEKINNAFNYVTRNKYNDIKEDVVEFKGEHNYKKTNEYQVKVSGSSSGAPNYLEDPLQGSKKEFATLTTDREDVAGSMIGMTVETKDEVTLAKSKEKVIQQTKAPNKFKAPPPKKIRRLNTEDIDEYKKMYDQMAISGSVLTFVSQKEKTGSNVRNFLCTVSDEIFDFSILRIITLGRNDENVEGERETERTGRTAQFNKVKVSSDEKEVLLNLSDDKGISNMPNFGELQLYRNPFDKPEAESETLLKSSNKEVVFRTIKTNPDTQDNSTSRHGLQEAKDRGLNKVISSANSQISQRRSSGYDACDNGKAEGDFQDNKDFIQEMLHDNGLDRVGANNSIAASMKGGIISKFEALLYKKEEGKVSNKFRAYVFIIAVCFVLAILNITITNKSLSEGSEKLQNLIFVGDRISNILSLNFNSRILYLHLHNYINIDRHLDDQGITDYAEYALNSVKTNARDLLTLNNAVMNDIYGLHPKSQPKFYETTVQLKYPTVSMGEHNVEALDSFKAVDTIALAALEISSVDLASLSAMDDNIQYILLNSMNQLYQEMKNGFAIYDSDLEKTLSNTSSATWGFAIAVLVTYVMFLFVLFRDLTNTHQDKIRFWNSLIKLDTVRNISHKRFLVIFKENFENSWNNEMLKKALIESKQMELRESRVNKAKENQANGFKKLKSYKFKNRSYFIVFPFLIILCIVVAFFIITGIRVMNEMENKRLYLQEITEAESYFHLNFLTLNGLYEYISEKNATVLLEQPIEEVLEDSLSSLSELAKFMARFKVRADFDPRIYIQMNFCDTYLTEEEKIACAKVAQGLNTQGLSSVLTFSKETMESALDFAKHSSQDDTTIKTAFDRKALITLETELKYISDGFKLLVESLADNELQEQSDFWATQIVVLVVFIVVMVLLNYLLVWNGFKRLDGQKFDNMKILRVIPSAMILESKMLTTYLLKSFKDDLSSITNKL